MLRRLVTLGDAAAVVFDGHVSATRIDLAEIGLPLVGDLDYGGPPCEAAGGALQP